MKMMLAILLVLALTVTGCSLFHKPPQVNIGDTHIGPPAATPQSNADKNTALTVGMTRWLILICLIGIGISGALFLAGNKLGIAGAAGSIITLIAAITVNQHLGLISWIGLAIIVAIVGLLIWQICVNRKALSEIIQSVDTAKNDLTDDVKNALFGKGGIFKLIQSPSTEKIVDAEQSKTKEG